MSGRTEAAAALRRERPPEEVDDAFEDMDAGRDVRGVELYPAATAHARDELEDAR